ncbi:MAG: shikimate dehydrogenase (NADP(+)) [Myxococcales bacterium]
MTAPPRVSGTTRVAAVLGWPVTHSRSPAMHNAAFQALGLDWVYVALPVAPGDLAAALDGARCLGLAGLNLTVPHKVAALPLLDALEPAAARVGAVNTVLVTPQGLVGTNTDGAGWTRSFIQDHGPIPGSVTLIGAGGAARAVAFAAVEAGATLRIAARDPGRAEALARDLCETSPGATVETRGLGRPVWSPDEDAPGLVVQATPLGMGASPGTEAWRLAEEVWEALLPQRPCPDTVFSDLVYTPRETAFLAAGARRGARGHEGLGMLVHQGAIALERWTGRAAPVEVMRAAVVDALTAAPPTY